eukprot:403342398
MKSRTNQVQNNSNHKREGAKISLDGKSYNSGKKIKQDVVGHYSQKINGGNMPFQKQSTPSHHQVLMSHSASVNNLNFQNVLINHATNNSQGTLGVQNFRQEPQYWTQSVVNPSSFLQNQSNLQNTINFDESKMSNQLRTFEGQNHQQLAKDKMFLKNISLRNMRQTFNPALKKSLGSSQSIIGLQNLPGQKQKTQIVVQKSSLDPSNLQQNYSLPSSGSLDSRNRLHEQIQVLKNNKTVKLSTQSPERNIDPNDPFNLMMHKNESVVQVIKRQKKQKERQDSFNPQSIELQQLQQLMMQKQMKQFQQQPQLVIENGGQNSQTRVTNQFKAYNTQAEKISHRQKKMANMLKPSFSNINLTTASQPGNIFRKTQISFANNIPNFSTLASPQRNQRQNSFQNLKQMAISPGSFIQPQNILNQQQNSNNQPFNTFQNQGLNLQKQINLQSQKSLKSNKTLTKKQSVQKKTSSTNIQSSERRSSKQNLTLNDHYQNFYQNLRMRSGSTDRMTNDSKELRDNSVESTQQQEIKRSSKQTKVVQRKRSSSDRNKVVQNIQNNINLQFAGATQILDPFTQDSQKTTEVQQYFITEALSLTQKVSPSLSDFLLNLATNLKDQYEKQLNFLKQDIQQYQKVIEELQEQIQLEQSKIATFNLEVSQLKKKTKIQDSTIQKKDQTIYQLEQQIDDLSKQNRQFLGKYDEGKILEEIKILVGENQELKSAVREVKSELDYGKQRENKLMYFLFVLQRKGIPIYDIFDLNIKDLATTRFSPDLDDQYKNIYFEQLKRILFKKLDGDDMPFDKIFRK